MKTKYTLFIVLWLSAVCCLFTACNDDHEQLWNPEISDSENQPIIGEGQFIVSYGTTEGPSTRVLSDSSLKANERISSLHYFVYEKKTGELIKQRKIRGIDKSTKWPIRGRDSMSWELRQDMQDTLVSGYTYRILFIANVDSTLFKLPSGDPHPAVVRNVNNYATAQILLPQVPFSDNNMYYMWEDTLNAEKNTTVKRNDVWLQRLVTRTDVKRADIKDTELEKHLERVIDSVIYNDTEINDLIDKDIANFCKRMVDQFDAYIIYNDLDRHAGELAKFLQTETVKSKVKKALKDSVINNYKRLIIAGNNYKQAGEWKSASKAEVTYQPQTRATIMGFDRKTFNDDKRPDTETVEVANGIFNIVGFAAKNAGTASTLNQLDTVKIFVSETESYTLDGKSLQIGLEINRKYKISCNPIDSIKFIDQVNYHPNINFYNILDGDPTWEDLKTKKDGLATLFGKIEDWVFDFGLFGEKIYGKDFNSFTFPSIDLPNITANNVNNVILVPSWTIIP